MTPCPDPGCWCRDPSWDERTRTRLIFSTGDRYTMRRNPDGTYSYDYLSRADWQRGRAA